MRDRQRLVAAEPDNKDYRQDLAIGYTKIGDTLIASGTTAEVLAVYQKALALFERVAAEQPDNTRWQERLAFTYGRIGSLLSGEAALTALRKALAIREALAKSDPRNAIWQRDLAAGYSLIGDALRQSGHSREALPLYEKALAHSKSCSPPIPLMRNGRDLIGYALIGLAMFISTPSGRAKPIQLRPEAPSSGKKLLTPIRAIPTGSSISV